MDDHNYGKDSMIDPDEDSMIGPDKDSMIGPDEDSMIGPDDSASILVGSETSESITDELTNSQRYRSPIWKHFSSLENEKKLGVIIYQKSVTNSDSSSLPEGQTQLDLSKFIKRPSKIPSRKDISVPNFTICANMVKRDVMSAYDKRKAFIKKVLQNVN
ncbi:25329_t:CDS:2, partial [Dentiscutata erythropus]